MRLNRVGVRSFDLQVIESVARSYQAVCPPKAFQNTTLSGQTMTDSHCSTVGAYRLTETHLLIPLPAPLPLHPQPRLLLNLRLPLPQPLPDPLGRLDTLLHLQRPQLRRPLDQAIRLPQPKPIRPLLAIAQRPTLHLLKPSMDDEVRVTADCAARLELPRVVALQREAVARRLAVLESALVLLRRRLARFSDAGGDAEIAVVDLRHQALSDADDIGRERRELVHPLQARVRQRAQVRVALAEDPR